MVAAAVTELQLVGAGSVGQGQDLVAQADSEYGIFPNEGTDRGNGLRYICGVAGPVGNQDSVRLQGPDPVRRGIPGQDRHRTSPSVQGTDDIAFHPAVNGGDPKRPSIGKGAME